MGKAFKSLLLIMAVIAIAAAVPAAEKQPPGKCKRCNMHVEPANKKYSVTVTEGIEPSSFDDIGCALLWREGESTMRMSAFDGNARVYDYHTEEPILVEKAFFVHNAGLKTPMGYDIAAFKKKEDAEKLVKEKGKGTVLTFEQVSSLKLK